MSSYANEKKNPNGPGATGKDVAEVDQFENASQTARTHTDEASHSGGDLTLEEIAAMDRVRTLTPHSLSHPHVLNDL